jgi:hypothetical protein
MLAPTVAYPESSPAPFPLCGVPSGCCRLGPVAPAGCVRRVAACRSRGALASPLAGSGRAGEEVQWVGAGGPCSAAGRPAGTEGEALRLPPCLPATPAIRTWPTYGTRALAMVGGCVEGRGQAWLVLGVPCAESIPDRTSALGGRQLGRPESSSGQCGQVRNRPRSGTASPAGHVRPGSSRRTAAAGSGPLRGQPAGVSGCMAAHSLAPAAAGQAKPGVSASTSTTAIERDEAPTHPKAPGGCHPPRGPGSLWPPGRLLRSSMAKFRIRRGQVAVAHVFRRGKRCRTSVVSGSEVALDALTRRPAQADPLAALDTSNTWTSRPIQSFATASRREHHRSAFGAYPSISLRPGHSLPGGPRQQLQPLRIAGPTAGVAGRTEPVAPPDVREGREPGDMRQQGADGLRVAWATGELLKGFMDDPVRGQLQPPRQRRRIWSSESRLPTRGPPCQVARLRGALDPVSQERLCARMARVRPRQATPPQAAASRSSSSSAGPLPAGHAEPPSEAPRLVGWLPLQPVLRRPPRRPRQLGSEERPCGGEVARLHSAPGQRTCGAGARCSMRAHRTAGRQRGPRNPQQASWPRGVVGSRHIPQQAQRGL